MDIGVAHAAVFDVNQHIGGQKISSPNGPRRKQSTSGMGSVALAARKFAHGFGLLQGLRSYLLLASLSKGYKSINPLLLAIFVNLIDTLTPIV
jgi:hypothetical protein